MTLDFMKGQRKPNVNMCMIQNVEAATWKQYSIPLALQMKNQIGNSTQLVPNRRTVAGGRKCQSTSVETTFRKKKETWA